MAIRPDQKGRCPHCRTGVRFEGVETQGVGRRDQIGLVSPSQHRLYLAVAACPECGRIVVTAIASREPPNNEIPIELQLWPDSSGRPVPSEVEAEAPTLAADFREAVSVLSKSKKASAALARRCLQFVLVHRGGVTEKDLSRQIDQVLASLPPALGANVDAIRQVGNYAAHPMKSSSSGEIVEVEDGEAEWLLDVLEELFDYYYVAPAQAAAKRAALNAKLATLNKPALKAPTP